METRIRQIAINGDEGERQIIDFGKEMPFTIEKGVLTVTKANVQAPVIIHGRGDEGLITSKGFKVTKHVSGKRIEFIDPKTGNCFVAKLGINSIEPISWYGENLDAEHWHDPDTPEIQAKRAFTKQYGMIIVPQYCLSFTEKHGLRSTAGEEPFTNRTWQESYDLFQRMKLPEGVSISMIAGFEVDRSLQHIIESGEATREQLTANLRFSCPNDSMSVYEIARAGTSCIDGVYNQTGLVRFWTQQMCGKDYRVVFGGPCRGDLPRCGNVANKSNREPFYHDEFWSSTGTLLFT